MGKPHWLGLFGQTAEKEETVSAIEPALIEKLPPLRLAEVRDFVDFLAVR